MFSFVTDLFSRPPAANKDGKKGVKSEAEKKALLAAKEKKKQQIEKKRRQEICDRQKKLMDSEIVQSWRIAMGPDIPKKKKDTFLIENITRRNVHMEDYYLFEQIKAQFPDEFFHPVTSYVLKWQPPGSYFQSIIPLNDAFLQENAILVMSQLLSKQQKHILFHFITYDPTLSLFAPKVHPSSLVSYRTKNEVLKKLSEYFLQGKISTEDITSILMCNEDVWRPALYNLLPSDEQVFHTYLTEVKRDVNEDKPIHKSYMDGEITLQEYEDLKYPDRKKKKDIESKEYPLPYEQYDCIICGRVKTGVIQCHTCDNMVCIPCVRSVFHGKTQAMIYSGVSGSSSSKKASIAPPPLDVNGGEVPQESFLLMHHKYCMKLGALPDVIPEAIGEPAYLREFRVNTRVHQLKLLIPETVDDFDDPNLYIEETEDEKEARRQEELRLQREREAAEEAARKLEIENPPELRNKRAYIEDRKKKYEKMKKEIHQLNEKVMDTSHNENYINRNKRLRKEAFVKAKKSVQRPLELTLEELRKMEIPGNFLPALIKEVEELLEAVELLYIRPEGDDDEEEGVDGEGEGNESTSMKSKQLSMRKKDSMASIMSDIPSPNESRRHSLETNTSTILSGDKSPPDMSSPFTSPTVSKKKNFKKNTEIMPKEGIPEEGSTVAGETDPDDTAVDSRGQFVVSDISTNFSKDDVKAKSPVSSGISTPFTSPNNATRKSILKASFSAPEGTALQAANVSTPKSVKFNNNP